MVREILTLGTTAHELTPSGGYKRGDGFSVASPLRARYRAGVADNLD